MDNFELWVKGCEINKSKIYPLEGEGRNALYKVWSEHLVRNNYFNSTPVFIGWVDGKQICATTNYQSALAAWRNAKAG